MLILFLFMLTFSHSILENHITEERELKYVSVNKTIAGSRNETVFYGQFIDYIWRNEKNGKSYFKVSTRQKMILKEQYQQEYVIHNPDTMEDEVWRTVICDGSEYAVPFFYKKTPVRICGHFKNMSSKGDKWEFKIHSIQEASSEDTTTIAFLASPVFPEIDYVHATKIVANHGADIFSFVERDDAAQILVRETGLKSEVIEHMIHVIKTTSLERRLSEFLVPMGIDYPDCAKAVKTFGSEALNCIRTDPYSSGHKIGLSFHKCDRIFKELGGYILDSLRIRAACYEAIDNLAKSGHIWSTLKEFYYAVKYVLNSGAFKKIEVPMSIVVASLGKGIVSEKYDGQEIIYSLKLYNAEKRVAMNLSRLCANAKYEAYDDTLITHAESYCNIKYGEQQKEAFSTILRKRGVKILTGGPGTGKTTTLKGILYAYQEMHPDHVIKLCAPTGRAAQRMSESTGLPATTIHRLLDYQPYGSSTICKGASNPIEADLIAVDEMSMTDIELFDIFLEAVKTETSIIVIGDIHQLESVGPGAVLHDLLKCEDSFIPKCMLTDVFRQKGGSPIIENAERINNGDVNLVPCDDFQIINTKSEEESMQKVKEIMRSIYNPNNPFETQILCPSFQGISGINNCNIVLHDLLNSGKEFMLYGSVAYRVNDKIIMTNNNYAASYYNGDIGVIKAIKPDGLVVSIRGEDYILTRDMLQDVSLAYGMTIHKSQGSEFPTVLVVMPMQPNGMLVRNLFYTAVTRAKKKVIIVNEGSAMETAIRTDHSGCRRTFLHSYLP